MTLSILFSDVFRFSNDGMSLFTVQSGRMGNAHLVKYVSLSLLATYLAGWLLLVCPTDWWHHHWILHPGSCIPSQDAMLCPLYTFQSCSASLFCTPLLGGTSPCKSLLQRKMHTPPRHPKSTVRGQRRPLLLASLSRQTSECNITIYISTIIFRPVTIRFVLSTSPWQYDRWQYNIFQCWCHHWCVSVFAARLWC